MKSYIFILFIHLNLISLFAQTDSLQLETDSISFTTISEPIDSLKKKNIWTNFKYDAASMGGGFLNVFTQPKRWKKDDYYKLGATILGVGLAFATDEQSSDFFRRQEAEVPPLAKNFGWYFGTPQVNYGVTGVIYTIGLLTNDEPLRKTGVLMITSASAAGLVQQVTKSLTGRGRPNADLGPYHFKPFGGSADYRSFPSGHTVLSVTTMYALSKHFSSPWLRAGCYVVGAIAPVSRLWAGAHWLSDVTLSAVISVAIVEGVDNYLKKKERYPNGFAPQKNRIAWNLILSPSQVGVRANF